MMAEKQQLFFFLVQDCSVLQRWCARRSDLCVVGGGGADAEGLGPDDGGHRAQPGGHGPHRHHCQLHAERAVPPEGHSGCHHTAHHRVIPLLKKEKKSI